MVNEIIIGFVGIIIGSFITLIVNYQNNKNNLLLEKLKFQQNYFEKINDSYIDLKINSQINLSLNNDEKIEALKISFKIFDKIKPFLLKTEKEKLQSSLDELNLKMIPILENYSNIKKIHSTDDMTEIFRLNLIFNKDLEQILDEKRNCLFVTIKKKYK